MEPRGPTRAQQRAVGADGGSKTGDGGGSLKNGVEAAIDGGHIAVPDPLPTGQHFDRVAEAEAVDAFHEANDIPADAAAVAVPDLVGWVEVEVGILGVDLLALPNGAIGAVRRIREDNFCSVRFQDPLALH